VWYWRLANCWDWIATREHSRALQACRFPPKVWHCRTIRLRPYLAENSRGRCAWKLPSRALPAHSAVMSRLGMNYSLFRCKAARERLATPLMCSFMLQWVISPWSPLPFTFTCWGGASGKDFLQYSRKTSNWPLSTNQFLCTCIVLRWLVQCDFLVLLLC